MEKYKNQYRIKSARHPHWDYSSNAAYFVTICTHNRTHYFGDIKNQKMNLSPIGHIANSCWHEIPNHFPFVELGPHIIMPNHVHGIIQIAKNIDDHDVETQNIASLQQQSTSETPKNKFGPQSQNLASIIRGFKIGVTKNVRIINPDFAWQARYHDHIIRNDLAYNRIANYIINNPVNWKEDKFYS